MFECGVWGVLNWTQNSPFYLLFFSLSRPSGFGYLYPKLIYLKWQWGTVYQLVSGYTLYAHSPTWLWSYPQIPSAALFHIKVVFRVCRILVFRYHRYCIVYCFTINCLKPLGQIFQVVVQVNCLTVPAVNVKPNFFPSIKDMNLNTWSTKLC